MFDQDELEELREDRYQWQGHVRRDVRTEKHTETSGRIFFSSVGAAVMMSVMLVVLMVSSSGTLALIGVTGIGGFGAEIDELVGEDVEIFPALGPTAACPSEATDGDFHDGNMSDSEMDGTTLPQLRAEITDADVPSGSEIVFFKDIEVPAITGLEMIRVGIGQQDDQEAGNVTLGDAALHVTALEADRLQAFDTEIREQYSDGTADNPRLGPEGEFVVTGTAEDDENQVVIEGASARAHFLSFSELQMPYLVLDIEYFNTTDENDQAFDGIPDPVLGDDDCPVTA